jgi:MFS family permease
MMKFPVFSAFRSRNYRLYFYGQSVSLIGTWMQRTAVSWVIYTLTHSPFMLGLSLFSSQFPSFVLGLFGGVVSDRYNRYKVLLATQIASLVQSLLLAILILTGHYIVWEILAVSVLLGCINAFDVPARQSLIFDMVNDKDDLPNALALNASMVNLARLVGPAFAGIVLQQLGAGACFLLNSLSFVAVIGSLLRMRLTPFIPTVHNKRVLGELREGFMYLKDTPSIAKVILMLGAMSLLVIPYATLLPIYAKVIFKGDASTFGYINSFVGLGAIAGSLFLASRTGTTDSSRKKILLVNTIVFGIGLIFFSYMASFPVAMLFAAVSGFGMMAQTTMTNTIIQTTVVPDMRGRVISYFAMAYFGMLPIGSLLVGSLSSYIGAPATILGEGIAALLIVGIFWKYLRSGSKEILPASTIKAASAINAGSAINAASAVNSSSPVNPSSPINPSSVKSISKPTLQIP